MVYLREIKVVTNFWNMFNPQASGLCDTVTDISQVRTSQKSKSIWRHLGDSVNAIRQLLSAKWNITFSAIHKTLRNEPSSEFVVLKHGKLLWQIHSSSNLKNSPPGEILSPHYSLLTNDVPPIALWSEKNCRGGVRNGRESSTNYQMMEF